jgi:hypothetical protein
MRSQQVARRRRLRRDAAVRRAAVQRDASVDGERSAIRTSSSRVRRRFVPAREAGLDCRPAHAFTMSNDIACIEPKARES